MKSLGYALCVAGLATIVGLTGCGGGSDLKLAPAKGVVKRNGQGVPNVGVTFFPDAGGPMSTGVTNAQGEFVMMTEKPGDGATIGVHKVTLGRAEESTSEKGDGFSMPRKYEKRETSGLTADVKAGEKNTFEFEITP